MRTDEQLLENVDIPYGTIEIANDMFHDNVNIESVNIPDTVETIGVEAFSGCKNLKKYNIPKSLTEIKEYAFKECDCEITSESPYYKVIDGILYFENENELIPLYCPKSKKHVELADNVYIISDSAFYGCSVESVKLPDSVKTIYYGAFEECKSLQTINIPNGVKQIYDGAFCDCSSLKSITIPDSVIFIGECAFAGRTSLKNVVIPKRGRVKMGEGIYTWNDALKNIL